MTIFDSVGYEFESMQGKNTFSDSIVVLEGVN